MHCLCLSSYNKGVKKILMIIGIVLLLGTTGFGAYALTQRHKNNELLKNPVLPTSDKTADTIDTTGTAQSPKSVEFDKTKYSTSDPTSPWVVVNKTRALNPAGYAPSDVTAVGNSQQLRAEAATALAGLIAAAKTEGLSIQALSGYRSYDRQVTVYGNEVKNYGQAVADTESARPGHSEHQTGWAVDVGGGGCGIEDCFGNTAEGKWVAAHAHEYGFIVRYIAGKQGITGYRAEPWHIRYIGTELSLHLHAKGVTTLEEFFNL